MSRNKAKRRIAATATAQTPMSRLGAAPRVMFDSPGSPAYTPTTVRNLAQYGYMQNPVVYRAVNIISEMCASIPLRVYENNDKHVIMADHPLTKLLENPHPKMAKSEFLIRLISNWIIAGTTYLFGAWPDSATFTTSTPPSGLYTLPPYYVTPQIDIATNELTAYRYDYGRGHTDYDVWRILPIKSFHPLDELNGFSPLFAASMAVDRMNEGEKWNISLMQHAARPSGAFITDGNMSDPDFDLLKGEIQEKYTGSNRAGIPMLLEGGLKYVQMGLSPLQIDWLNGDKDAGRKISMAIGVDPLLLNDKEHSTYNNVEQARIALVDQTSLPLLVRLCEDLNMWLMPYYGDNGRLSVDMKYIDLLRQDRQATSVMMVGEYNNGVRGFVSAQSELGIKTPDFIEEFYRMGIGVYVKEKDIPKYLQQQDDARTAPPLAPQLPVGAAGTQQIGAPRNGTSPQLNAQAKFPKTIVKEETTKIKAWSLLEPKEHKESDAPNAPTELADTFGRDLSTYVHEEKAAVLASLYGARSHEEALASVTVARHSVSEQLLERYLQHYATVADASAHAVQEQFLLVSGRPITIYRKDALTRVTDNATRHIARITDTLSDVVQRTVYDAPLHTLPDALTTLYDDTLVDYVHGLSKSASVAASNMGAWIAAKQLNLPLVKTWIATHHTHTLLHKMTYPLDTPFLMYGQYPGDTTDLDEEPCTCSLTFKYNQNHDEFGRFSDGSSVIPQTYNGNIHGLTAPPVPVLSVPIPLLPGDKQPNLFKPAALRAITPKIVTPPKGTPAQPATLPIAALKKATLVPLDAGYEGDNPRYTTTIGDTKYFVKEFQGNITGTGADTQVENEMAQRAGAMTIGLEATTVPTAVYTNKGASMMAQPFQNGYLSGVQDDDGYEAAIKAAKIPLLTTMVAHEYLAGTGDRHNGQYLTNANAPSATRLKLIDFGLGYPEHDMLEGTSALMDSMRNNGQNLSVAALSKIVANGDAYIQASGKYLDTTKKEYLIERMTKLDKYVSEATSKTVPISDFSYFMNGGY